MIFGPTSTLPKYHLPWTSYLPKLFEQSWFQNLQYLCRHAWAHSSTIRRADKSSILTETPHNSMRLWQCNLNYIRSNPRFNIETTNLCRLLYWSWNFGGYPKPPLIEGGVVTAMPQANEDAGVWSWRMIQTWKMQMCSKTWKHTPYSAIQRVQVSFTVQKPNQSRCLHYPLPSNPLASAKFEDIVGNQRPFMESL